MEVCVDRMCGNGVGCDVGFVGIVCEVACGERALRESVVVRPSVMHTG